MTLLSCFRGAPAPPYGSADSSAKRTIPCSSQALDTISESQKIAQADDGLLVQLIQSMSALDGGWWCALSTACKTVCELLSADHACVYVVSPSDGWAATAACAGLGAEAAAARVYCCDPRSNASAAAALMRECMSPVGKAGQRQGPPQLTSQLLQPQALLFRDAPAAPARLGRGGASSSVSGSGGLSSCSAALDSLPADWAMLRDAEGCIQFAAVGCVAPGGSLLGVLSIAARGPSRPAPWRPESLHCAVGLLSGHIRRAAQVLASPPVSAMAAAASFSELVAAAAEAAAEAAEAAGHVRGQIRVAFVRADLGTAAVFQQRAPAPRDSDAQVFVAPAQQLLRARRSSCEFVASHAGRRNDSSPGRTGTNTGYGSIPRFSMDVADTVRRDLVPGLATKMLSFSLPTVQGITCRGHTLSLGRTLLDEALGKGVAGLCIDDCQAYTVGAKAYPRDLVLTRGSLLPTSLALATVPHPDSGEPLLAVYVTYDTMLPKQLLAAVVAEMEQLLRALAPLVASKLDGQLKDEYEHLVAQLKHASSRKALRHAATAAALATATATATVDWPGDVAGADTAKATWQPAQTAAGGAAAPAFEGRPSPAVSAAGASDRGAEAPATPVGSPFATHFGAKFSDPPSLVGPEAELSDAPEPGRSPARGPVAAADAGGVRPASPAARQGQGQALGGAAAAAVPMARRLLLHGAPARANSDNESGLQSNRRLLSALPKRSVSFRLEAAQSPRGASKLAPLIASMHERLKAAQAAALTTGRSEARKADIRSLKLLEEIGRGGYGTVYRGTYHGAEVAVKLIAQSRLASGGGAGGAHTNTVNGPNGPGGPGGVTSACLGLHKQHLHDAIELVASVSMSHTNIVQVPAYFLDVRLNRPSMDTLNPLDTLEAPTDSRPFGLVHSPSLLESELDTHGQAEMVGMALVLEFCDCGSLCDAICERRFMQRVTARASVDNAQPKTYLAVNMRSVYLTLLEISLALRHMHGLALVHCDLKPQNVLLKSSPRDPRGFTAKLSDFGLAKMMAHDERGQLVIDEAVASGTITHVAPEVLLGQDSLGAAVDVYAFGVLMFQILCGVNVYDKSLSAAQIANAVAHTGMRPTFPSWVPASYRSLAESCWHESPASRPTADDLVRHLENALEARKKGASGASSGASGSSAATTGSDAR